MPRISKKTKTFIQQYFPYIKVRQNEIKFAVNDEVSYEIPGELYPLRNQSTTRVFTYADTEQLEAESFLATLYNEISFRAGFCYTNTELLEELLLKAGVRNIKTYTGWIFVDGMPIHHCWLVYKDIHVFDPGISKIDDMAKQALRDEDVTDIEQARAIYKEFHEKYKDYPNSEIRTFGQVAPFSFYIGTETTPNQGRKIYNDLINVHPDHPSYEAEGMNAHGASVLQKQLAEK